MYTYSAYIIYSFMLFTFSLVGYYAFSRYAAKISENPDEQLSLRKGKGVGSKILNAMVTRHNGKHDNNRDNNNDGNNDFGEGML